MSSDAEHYYAGARAADTAASGPKHGGLVLTTLILVAAVANLNLAVANVALPSIGKAFNASQTRLDLVTMGYSLGLATSVLWLGALGDRYGRKQMLLIGTTLAIPASLMAGFAPGRSRCGRLWAALSLRSARCSRACCCSTSGGARSS